MIVRGTPKRETQPESRARAQDSEVASVISMVQANECIYRHKWTGNCIPGMAAMDRRDQREYCQIVQQMQGKTETGASQGNGF